MMTYRSSYNSPDKIDYSNFAFKKSEILEVLRALNSNFSFEIIPSYKDTFFKHDIFNGFEVACLISGYDPNTLSIQTTRKVDWQDKNPKFVEALNLVMSTDMEKHNGFWREVDANFYECEYLIKNEDLKLYLASKSIIIKNFNDNLQITKSDEQDHIHQENKKLKIELAQSQARIAELESKLAIEQVEIQTKQLESKLSTREENNIIKVLAVLADMEKKIDISKPYEAHGIMSAKANLLGIEPFPSNGSIKKWFSKANEYKNPN